MNVKQFVDEKLMVFEITEDLEEKYKNQIKEYANLLKYIYKLPVNKSLYKFHNKKLQIIDVH